MPVLVLPDHLIPRQVLVGLERLRPVARDVGLQLSQLLQERLFAQAGCQRSEQRRLALRAQHIPRRAVALALEYRK